MVELHLKFRSKGQLYLKAKNPAECAEWHRQLTSAMSNARRICQRMEASMSRSTITPSANKPIRRSSGGDCSQWYGFGLPRLTVTGTGPIIRPSETQCRPSVPVVGFPSTKFPTAKQSGLVRSFLQSIAEHGTVRTAQDWQNLSEVIRARRRPDFTRFQLEPAKLLRPVAGWVPDPLHPGFCTAQPQD